MIEDLIQVAGATSLPMGLPPSFMERPQDMALKLEQDFLSSLDDLSINEARQVGTRHGCT